MSEQNTDDFKCRLNNIDNCKVGNYSERDLHEIYFQAPDKLVPLLNIIKNKGTVKKKI